MRSILPLLTGGDRRSIGGSNTAAALALNQPKKVGALVAALTHDSDVVRMRAADALEKVSALRPDVVMPFRRTLLAIAARTKQQELRWHLAQILPRLSLSAAGRARLVPLLFSWTEDQSRIVQVNALQALAELSAGDAALKERVLAAAANKVETGTPALRARARKIVAALAR